MTSQTDNQNYCIPSNSYILTNEGYIEIDKIFNNCNDYKIMTNKKELIHINSLGKYKYKRDNIIYKIKLDSHPYFNCTPNQILYCKENKDSIPKFKIAKKISNNDYIGMPVITKNKIKIFDFMSLSLKMNNSDFYYICGYYLGNGKIITDNNYNDCIIWNFANNQKNVYLKISKIIDLKPSLNNKNEYYQYNDLWCKIFNTFGRGNNEKTIPLWLMESPDEYISSFIDGYFDSCNYKIDNDDFPFIENKEEKDTKKQFQNN